MLPSNRHFVCKIQSKRIDEKFFPASQSALSANSFTGEKAEQVSINQAPRRAGGDGARGPRKKAVRVAQTSPPGSVSAFGDVEDGEAKPKICFTNKGNGMGKAENYLLEGFPGSLVSRRQTLLNLITCSLPASPRAGSTGQGFLSHFLPATCTKIVLRQMRGRNYFLP